MQLAKIAYYLTGILGLEKSDVLLVSYPRAGTTWLRTILCNYLFIQERNGMIVDLHNMDPTMPALGNYNLMRPWPFNSLPRFVKTHLEYRQFLLGRPTRVLYVIRDPRDIMVSYFHFLGKNRIHNYSGNFSDFLHNDEFGLMAFFRHFNVWEKNVTNFIKYEDLKLNTLSALEIAFSSLDIEFSIEHLTQAIDSSTLANMKNSQQEKGFAFSNRFQKGFQPVRLGKTQQWPDYFSEQDLKYYEDLCVLHGFELYKKGYFASSSH